MISFDDLAIGHPLAKSVTIIREGRDTDIQALALFRLGADYEVQGESTAAAEYQARFHVRTIIAQDDMIVTGNNRYVVEGDPLEKPDQDSLLVTLQVLTND